MAYVTSCDKLLAATGPSPLIGGTGSRVSTVCFWVVQTSSTGTIVFRGYMPDAIAAAGESGMAATDFVPLSYTIGSTGGLTVGTVATATGVTAECFYVRADAGMAVYAQWTRTGGTLRLVGGVSTG